MDKVKLAFIGSGGIVRSHLDQGLKDFPDVAFVGWCDLSEETAAARKEQVGGQGEVYTDARQMLKETKPDAVYIMLPPYAHGEAEALVLEHKLPFFVEKPVAIDLDTALRVAEGVNQHGLLTSVGYMNRYRESVLRVTRDSERTEAGADARRLAGRRTKRVRGDLEMVGAERQIGRAVPRADDPHD